MLPVHNAFRTQPGSGKLWTLKLTWTEAVTRVSEAHVLVLAFLGAQFTSKECHVRRLAKVALLENSMKMNQET